jgi:hypothetical protein
MTLSLTAPPWVVALIGFTVVLSGIAYFLWRARRWPTRLRRIGQTSKGRTQAVPTNGR